MSQQQKIGIFPAGLYEKPPIETIDWAEGSTAKTDSILTIGYK